MIKLKKSHWLAVVIGSVLLGLLIFSLIPEKKLPPKKTYRLGDDKMIVHYGKKDMAYYSGGMKSGTSTRDPKKYDGDRMSTVYFDAQLREDGSIWLVNLRYDPESLRTCCYNNHLIVRLNASTWYQHGQWINREYQELLDNSFSYGKRAGELYGLERYILYSKKTNGRYIGFDEFLVTMKADGTPLRLIKTVSPPVVRESGGGGATHYFMYNDWIQVHIHYRKYILKDWYRIETAMRQYLDQLYAEAQHD